MNIYEIAKKANLSIATISRAINPSQRHKVAPSTLKKIDSLTKKLCYTPNLAARHLGRCRFKTIGLVLPHFSKMFYTDYYVHVLTGLADALLDSDYRFKLITLKSCLYDWDDENHLTILKDGLRDNQWDHYNFKVGEGVDSLLITHWPLFFSNLRVLERLGVPCFAINDPEPVSGIRFSTGDNLMGGRLAAENLYLNGHRKIGILSARTWSRDSALRIKGFKSFFDEMDTHYETFILNGDFCEQNAARVTENFLKKSKKRVTAFFCCNDLMAFGVMKALRKLQIVCPKEISVVGYDNDKGAALCNPPLTTIHVPVYELVKEGVKQLIDYLDNPEKTSFYNQILFPVKLIERKSVAKIG